MDNNNGIVNETVVFSTMREIRDHLEGLGFQGCSVPQLYKHRQEGHLKPPPLPEADLMGFALTWLRQAPHGSAGDDKTAAEARRLSAQAELAETRAAVMRGLYIERSEYERALALRALRFKSDLANMALSEAPQLVVIAGGDPLRASDVAEFLAGCFEDVLARYAEDAEFGVPTLTLSPGEHE